MTDTSNQWWREHDEVVRLAYWMLEQHETARNIVLMVEKPWKFEDEYRQCLVDNAVEEAEAMHRHPGESYLGMLVRNRQRVPNDTQRSSGELGTPDA
jgi:hypothetical protein